MRALIVIVALSVAGLVSATTAVAQEGHPLKGSWLGTWASNQVHGEDVVVVLNWDGKSSANAIKNATLNPEGWVVHIEADAKDKAGAVVSYVIDGKIENLALHNRTITGTWKSPKGSGPFKIARQ